jgi:hypothetical protein
MISVPKSRSAGIMILLVNGLVSRVAASPSHHSADALRDGRSSHSDGGRGVSSAFYRAAQRPRVLLGKVLQHRH